jgi:lysophospholipase L1-like esterase
MCAAAVLVVAGDWGKPAEAASSPACGGSRWVGSWATSPAYGQQRVFEDQTLRLVVHPNIGGQVLRVRLSNRFGTTPLRLGAVRIARRESGAALVADTSRRLSFGGRRSLTVARGRDVVSDPVALRVRAFQELAVSIHVRQATGGATSHPFSFQTSHIAAGDRTADRAGAAFSETLSQWYFLTGIDVRASKRTGAVVAFGASSVDGTGSPVDENHRFTDFLAHRLQARTRGPRLSVLNQGVAGNRLLVDTTFAFGPSLLSRLEPDVIQQPGVSDVIVWLGSGNDFRIAPPATPRQVIDGLRKVIARLRRRHLNVILAPISPSAGSSFPAAGGVDALNAKRRAVNRWIRTSRVPDAVVDLDAVLRDPARPDFLNPRYDSGDGQHPNSRGYRAVARAFRLSQFKGPACARAQRG